MIGRDLRKTNVEHDTYCITAVYMFRWVQVQLFISLVLAISTLIVLIFSSLGRLQFVIFNDLVLFVFRPLIYISMVCYLQVYLFMTAEQIIMRSLILFERDKDINEVTFIYNNTNQFMVRERKMNIAMKIGYMSNLIACFSFLFVLFYEGVDFLMDDRLDFDDQIRDLKFVLYILLAIILVCLFIFQILIQFHLFYLMYKLHYLEFRRVFFQMLSVFISQIFFHIFSFIFIIEWYHIYNDERKEYSHYWTMCNLEDFEIAEVYLFWVLQLPYLAPCATVILFKSSQDIIQGVSKLDYLYKVS